MSAYQDIKNRFIAREGTYMWVDLAMTLRVMVFDVFKLCRASESLLIPIQLPQPFV